MDRPRTTPHVRVLVGFTLVEILIVVTIIALLASIVIANFGAFYGFGRAETMSSTVSHVREVIALKSAAGDDSVGASGYPVDIDPLWFTIDQLPTHTWTKRPMVLEVEEAGDAVYYPAQKTFDASDAAAANAWYNPSNGAFSVLVGLEGEDEEIIEMFNIANIASITDLEQIGR